MTRFRSIAVGLVALVLVGGAAVLAVLQVRWVTAASRDEEARLRTALVMGLSQVRRDAEDELRVLATVLRLTIAEVDDRDWSGLQASLGLWYATTAYPRLVRELYVVTDPGSTMCLQYDQTDASFRVAPLPEDLGAELGRVGQIDTRDAGDAKRQGYLLLPVMGSAGPGAMPLVRAAVAVELDTNELHTIVLPALVERHLAGFPYRVVTGDPPMILYQSGVIPNDADPELTLSGLTLGDTRWMATEVADGGGDTKQGDPALRFWLLRLREEKAAPPPQVQGGPDTGVRLEVYYPGGSIETVVRTRRVLNLGVSGGLLAVLLLGALLLYRLYHRSSRLRLSEQEFVATVSHELRTPITVIQATSENLRRGIIRESERVTQYGGVIHDQARRLSRMVEAILYYSGIEPRRNQPPTRSPLELSKFITGVLEPLGQIAAESGKQLVHVDRGSEGEVEADATAVRLVLENLVMNAVHHADEGVVRIRGARGAAGGVVITVEDNGPGIPAREQRRVFERFARGERSVRDQHPGSGLGLHLVRRVARMHGGEVRLESPYTTEQGVRCPGCRFTVTLP